MDQRPKLKRKNFKTLRRRHEWQTLNFGFDKDSYI